LKSTATSRARERAGYRAVSTRPSAPVKIDTRDAVIVVVTPSPIRRGVVAAGRGVVSVPQSIRIYGHIIITGASVVVGGLRRGYAGPRTSLRVVSKCIVLAL